MNAMERTVTNAVIFYWFMSAQNHNPPLQDEHVNK